MLRVHSADLHEHVAAEIGECLSSGIFTDLQINCKVNYILIFSYNKDVNIHKCTLWCKKTNIILIKNQITVELF